MVASTAPKGASAAKSEVWSKKNACVVCTEVCKTEEEKKVHEGKQTHIKKMSIHTFLGKEAAKIASSDLPSTLLRRFSTTKERAIGLDCMHEIRFPWSSHGWWVCSICYDSGCTFEQAEQHVRSVRHLSTYLDEFDPDKAAKVDEFRRDAVEHYEQLICARNEIYKEQGEMLLPPEILELTLTKEVAMAKLVVGTVPTPGRVVYSILKDEDTTKRAIIKCTTCFEVIPCFKKNLTKVWIVHENTPGHRRCSAITGILNQLPCEEVIEADVVIDEGPYNWRHQNGVYFGPVCGITYLLTCGSENYCTLCFCKVKSIEQHFSSEHHIFRFITMKKTPEMFAVFQHNGVQRRSRMAELLMETPLDTESHRKLPSNFLPSLLLEFSNDEVLDAREFMPPVGNFGFDGQCLICEDCCLVIKVPQEKDSATHSVGIWNDHVGTSAHFDFMARRSSFRFYDEFFVPLVSSVSLPKPSLQGEWRDIEVDDNTSYRIQTQCDVGLEWIVEDQENGEVVCTLCARTYKKDSKDAIKNHVRSYMHLNQYLHMTNRELLAIVMMQNSEKAVLDLIMQWLQTNSKVSQSIMYDPTFMQPTVLRENWSQIRVYSPDKANRIAKKHRVPTRMVSLPYCDPTLRPLIACLAPVIDAVAQDGVEKETVDLREALCVSSIRIIHMDDQDNLQSRRWLLRCMACQMVFSTTVEKLVHDVWEDHMHSADHDRRIHNYETCNLDMCGFAEASSTYTVKPFVQADPNKKVTWQWNAKSKVHDFVLCVIGLEDLVERKSNFTDGAHNPDFFCRLCAEVIPRRAALLEEHVRSGRHVMSYVQKYNPMTFFQVDSFKSDEGGKLLRRTVAQLLKDVKPPSEYCIPVYDPIGEQERKGQLAVAQAKEADRLRSIEESRKKAQEARVARDEERRKLLAIELEKEKKRRAERDRREAEAKARVALMEAEKERIKQMAEAERSRLRRIAEEKMKEKTAREKEEKEKKESARRQRERNDLKAQLEQKKAKLKDQEKQLKLVMEKKELEKRHSELLQKAAAMQKQKNSVPEPKLMIAPQLSSQPVPQMSMMNMPPPMLTKAMTMDFSMPPPIYGSFELGAKPNFSTYVPTAEAMPVYPMDGDMMDVDSRSSSRSSSRSRSTSRDRRRSRDRKRSRSRSRSRSRRKSRRSHSRSRNRRTGDKVRNVSKSPSPVPISPPTDDQQKTLTPKREKEGERKSLQGRTIDPQVADERTIKNRADLVDFLWRHGAEKIPSDELPDTFTKKAAEVEGNVGIDNVYEVVCLDSSDLDTFYCSICGMWTTPSEMLKHIATSEHKLAFMYRNNKQSHGEIMSETNSAIRRTMLDQFALKTWKEDQKNPKTVCNRLRAVLNRATICRVWPEHIHLLDHSWKMDGLGIPAPVSKDVYSGAFSIPPPNFSVPPPKPVPAPPGFAVLPPSMTPIGYPPPVTTQTVAAKTSSTKKSSSGSSDKDKRKRSPTPRSSRKRSSSRDRHRSPRRRSRSPRRRSRSPPKKKRSRSRSRDRTRRRSRSRDRSRRSPDRSRRSSSRTRTSRSSKDDVKKKAILSKDDLSWVDTAAAFLEKLGDVNGAQQIRTQPVASQAVVKPQPVVTSSAPSLIPSIGTSTPQQLPTTRIQPQQMLYRAPPPLTTLPPVRIGFSQPMQHQNPPPQQQPECIVLDDDAPSTVRDEKAEMRKLLGVLITMQQEAERNGGLDPATVDRLYQEVGLKKTEGLNSDQLLAQLLTQLASNVPAEKKTVDLSAFGISASAGPSAPLRPPVHQPPPSFYPQQQQYTPAPSLAPIQPQQQKPTDPQLQKLLQGIGDSLKAMPRSQAEPIYKPNPYTITRTEDFYGDSGMSYVYPDRAEEQPQPVPVPAPVATEQPDPKKEKAALRKKMLLEQAERLRKQAEASSDAEDDDWDNLESEMTQMLDSAPVATTTAAATTPLDRSSPSLRQAKMGVPTTWMQPVPQPKPPSLTPSVAVAPQPEVVPIAPGQKMPLARTMLPNGKLPPGVQQQQPRQETPPTSTAETPASSVPQPTLAQFQQQPGFSGAYPQQQPAQGYMQPMYGGYPQQQYGQMYGQPQQYPYMQQQGYGMQQQYMQPAPPGAAYPQQQTTQQQQQYYAQYGQQQPQQQYKY